MTKRLKILASDDDDGIRSFLFSLLAERGHDLEFAKDSDEVFKLLGKERFDLLILDVNTPGINGYKVAEKISSNITNRPKILIFTARDVERENFQFATCGADAIIRKGAPCEKILASIDDLFHELPQAGAEAALSAEAPAVRPECPAEPAAEAVTRVAPPEEPAALRRLEERAKLGAERLSRLEDQLTARNMRYEEFIRELLREKQRTEKNYLEFKRVDAEVARLRNWGYAAGAAAALALLRSFF